MSRSRRSKRPGAVHISLSSIKYDSTCVNIVPGGLPIALACENCKPKLDIHSKKSSKKEKKERHKHATNKCKQYWISRWSDEKTSQIGLLKQHNLIRRYLNIELDVKIEFEEVKKRKFNLVTINEQNTQCEDMPSNCIEQPVNPEFGFTGISNNRKDMLPIGMPDVAGDVVNDTRGHTPLVTGDVISVLPSHPLARNEDLGEAGGVISTFPSQVDLRKAGGVINTSPSVLNHEYAGGVVNTNPSNIDLGEAGGVVNTNPSFLSSDKVPSNLYTTISRSELALLRNDADLGKRIRKKLTQKKFKCTPLGRSFLGIAMMHVPKLALESAERFIVLVLCWFMADLGLLHMLSSIPAISPSANTLKDIMVEEAIDTIVIEREDMKGVPLGLMCDKGEGEKKRNGASFVKLVPRFDKTTNKIKVTCIGIQSAGNFSVDAAEGVDHALKPYDHDNQLLQFEVQGTDAGGGGTRKDLADKLESRGRVKEYVEYIWSTCALHGLNLTLSSPTNLIMGDGGLLKRTALQCLHTAYNLAQQYHYEEWKDIWMLLTGEAYTSMKMPVMSRWECVGESVNHILKYKEMWLDVAKNIVQKENTGTTKHTIASYLTSYLVEPMILAHLYFLKGYITSWWEPHFSWQKHVDEQTKVAGFLGCHMAVHFFIQHRDLEELSNNWKDNANFAAFVGVFPENNIYTIDQLAKDFFARAKDRHEKHFGQWRLRYLYLALGGESLPAEYIAKWLVGKELPSGNYMSSKHNTVINLSSMGGFLTSGIAPESLKTKEFFRLHQDAIVRLSEGEKLWDSEGSETVINFRNYVKQKWFIVVTNTQLVERWVKDSNECTHSGKEDHIASLVAMCRSATVFEYKYEAKVAAQTRILKANQHFSAGKIGSRVIKKTGEQETNTNTVSDVRGSYYTAIVINRTMERNNRLVSMRLNMDKRKEIRKQLTSRADQLRSKRTEHTIEGYATSAYSDTARKALNTIQNQTGFDVTNHMRGEVPYSSLRITHIEYVRDELHMRGVAFDNGWSIKKLAMVLKNNDLELQKDEILQKTGNKNPHASELNSKTFLPIHRSAEDYEMNL